MHRFITLSDETSYDKNDFLNSFMFSLNTPVPKISPHFKSPIDFNAFHELGKTLILLYTCSDRDKNYTAGKQIEKGSIHFFFFFFFFSWKAG